MNILNTELVLCENEHMKQDRTRPGQRREALRAFMSSRKLKPGPWAEKAGVSRNVLYNFLNGHVDSLNQSTLEKLAITAGTSISELFGDTVTPLRSPFVPVSLIGEVQAGAWREAMELPREEWEEHYLPHTPYAVAQNQTFLLRVRGTSMNRVYPPGTMLQCVPLFNYAGEIKSGDKVIVERRNPDGLVEATCKELGIEDGAAWLWPRSTDPNHQTPLRFEWPVTEGLPASSQDETVEITAVVIRSIRSEV